MGDSRTLKNHKAEYPFRADRDYIAFEKSLCFDLSAAVQILGEDAPDVEMRSLFIQAVDAIRNYDRKRLQELTEAARTRSTHYTMQGNKCFDIWSSFLMMFCNTISGGMFIASKNSG